MNSRPLYYLLLLLLIVTSCKNPGKENRKSAGKLQGTWVLQFGRDGEIPSQLFKWEFMHETRKKGNYEFYWIADYPVKNTFSTITAEKGSFRIEGDRAYLEPIMFGTQQAEPMSEVFYDSIVWFERGDPRFDQFQSTDSMGFEQRNDSLILKIDINGDGDWTDPDEVTAFAKWNQSPQ